MARPRLTRATAAGAAAALLILGPAIAVPAAAAGAVVAAPAAVAASPLADATTISRAARTLRAAVASQLGGYLTTYGDRFTEAERSQLTDYKANADRQLAGVVVATERLRRAIDTAGTPLQIRTAARAAQTAHTRAKSAADASYAQARVIAEPRLSLFERVQALSDYSRMMGRFDVLGDRINALAKAYA